MTKSRAANALRQYQSVGVKTGIEGATPHRLVQMLMAGALDKIATAKGAMSRGEVELKGAQINWASSIIGGLRGALDMEAGGEISRNLDDLYDYMIRRLMEAHLKNDPDILDEVTSLLSEIKGAWDAMPDSVKNPPPEVDMAAGA
ncbi:MAG TPA: flagellar export chaperone FliS [Sedimenticola sp.]|nr:flagellar export chaperone FliS [Sedimenticola sp.]